MTAHNPDPILTLHAAAKGVVQRLQEAGHKALFAGGCVRDMLMGKKPNDFDVATSATPQQVTALFRRTQQVGAKFGVVLVRSGPHDIEVATFRRDMDYADGRHPGAVEFTDAREDAIRRDFTINGMFYDPLTHEVVDYVDGRADIEAKLIRAIGEPDRRFAEDHLRMLRAIRFSARLGFKIEPQTFKAIGTHAREIARIAPERIREELEMILTHPSRATALRQIVDTGLFQYLWPGAGKLLPHIDPIMATVAALPAGASFEASLAALFQHLHRADIEEVCAALRCSNYSKDTAGWLVEEQDTFLDPVRITAADLKLRMAHPAFAQLLDHFAARLAAAGKPSDAFREISTRAAALRPEEVAPPPLLTGHDLADMGLPQGPIYKKILERVYYAQLNGELQDASAARALATALASEFSNVARTPIQKPPNGAQEG